MRRETLWLLAAALAGCQAPLVKITVDCPGACPLEIEQTVAEPIESRLVSLPGLARITSVSTPGRLEAYVRGEPFTSGDRMLERVSAAVKAQAGLLPFAAQAPRTELLSVGQEEPAVPAGEEVNVISLRIDREKVARNGLSPRELAAAVAEKLKGTSPDEQAVRELAGTTLQIKGRRIAVAQVAEVKLLRQVSPRVRVWPPE